MNYENPEMLSGFKKKSFSLPYGGGEIWFEHLDSLYDNADLVLEKLNSDRQIFCRPSCPSMIGFVLDETVITKEIVEAIADVLLNSSKIFLRVCFIGSDRKTERALRSALLSKTFFLAFINDFEKAKEWFVKQICK